MLAIRNRGSRFTNVGTNRPTKAERPIRLVVLGWIRASRPQVVAARLDVGVETADSGCCVRKAKQEQSSLHRAIRRQSWNCVAIFINEDLVESPSRNVWSRRPRAAGAGGA